MPTRGIVVLRSGAGAFGFDLGYCTSPTLPFCSSAPHQELVVLLGLHLLPPPLCFFASVLHHAADATALDTLAPRTAHWSAGRRVGNVVGAGIHVSGGGGGGSGGMVAVMPEGKPG